MEPEPEPEPVATGAELLLKEVSSESNTLRAEGLDKLLASGVFLNDMMAKYNGVSARQCMQCRN